MDREHRHHQRPRQAGEHGILSGLLKHIDDGSRKNKAAADHKVSQITHESRARSLLVCVGVAAGLFAIAYAAEKYVYKRDGITERILSTRKITMIGLFSALAMILHIFDFPDTAAGRGLYRR